MICTVTSSLIGQSVIKRFCAPAWIKPLRKPMTPSPARASPEPVSQAESVTNQVPCKLRFGDALSIVQRRFGFGLDRSRILLSEKSMGGQMQNVGRMDLEQRFFCRVFLGEIG